jgi:hypothetical protein
MLALGSAAEGPMIPRTVDVFAFALAVLLTGVGIKLMSLLPERYYFSFSQIVDAKNQSQFLARPELPSPASFCRSLHDEEVAASTEVPQAVIDACGKIETSILSIHIPANARLDNVPLHSSDYKENLQELLAAIRASAPLLRDGINASGRTYKRPIEGLDDEALEAVLFTDGTANLTSLALYAMSAKDSDWDVAYESTETLRDDATVSSLLETHSELDEADRAALGEDGSQAATGRKYLHGAQESSNKAIRSFLMKEDKFLFWPALLLKLLPAFIVGMLMALLFREKGLEQAPLAVAFTAFLFCWPVIVLWDNVVSDEWKPLRAGFYALYIAYIITYFFAARLGAMLMLASPAVRIPDMAMKELEWNKIFATAAATVISSVVTGAITWTISMAT